MLHKTCRIVPSMVVGLTGGIACGKTTVAQMLIARGATVIDADQVARDVVRPGTEGLISLVEAFGPEVLTPEGSLDRPKLGKMVFSGAASIERLNQIIHPRVANESMKRIGDALATDCPLIVYDAALLIETGRHTDFRPLIVVTATPAVQQRRLMDRDSFTAEDAQQRIDAQMPVADKAELADYVIDNSGSLQDTEAQVSALWDTLMRGIEI
jgi:dephospho-CoA kinase